MALTLPVKAANLLQKNPFRQELSFTGVAGAFLTVIHPVITVCLQYFVWFLHYYRAIVCYETIQVTEE